MGLLSTIKMYTHKPDTLDEPTDLYDHRVKLLEGGELDLETLRGKPTLIVNTASKCGLTPQFAGLQALYDEYADRGLQILGSPSADFAGQEYDDADRIGAFCQRNYGVSFPLTERTSVRADPDPLWDDLGRQPNAGPPSWNFAKYLIGADGKLIASWSPQTAPQDERIVAAIEAALPEA